MNERDELRLRHLPEAADVIAGFMAGVERAAFLRDRKLQDAVIRNLEVIGEACVQLTGDLREKHSELPWTQATAIRNRLVHGYFDVDLGIVWRTATESVPAFAEQVRELLTPKL